MNITLSTSGALMCAQSAGLETDAEHGLALPARNGFPRTGLDAATLAEFMRLSYDMSMTEADARKLLVLGRIDALRAGLKRQDDRLGALARDLDGEHRDSVIDAARWAAVRLLDMV